MGRTPANGLLTKPKTIKENGTQKINEKSSASRDIKTYRIVNHSSVCKNS